MTAGNMIEKVDTLKPNQYETADKLDWIADLEAAIYEEITSQHEGAPETFSRETFKDAGAQLTVTAPYDDIYLYYLSAQIDLYNRELTSYAQTATLYNTAWDNYSAWYTRNHMPKSKVKEFML